MKQFPAPKLVPLDMSRCTVDREKRGHPDINTKDTYLCLIDGQYYTGQFQTVWFGWSFTGWHGCSLQFDPPRYNSSRWQQIWKLVDSKRRRRVRLPEDKCRVEGCTGRLKVIDTCEGDPEGIRHDRQCRKCGQIYGCSKSSLFKLQPIQTSIG